MSNMYKRLSRIIKISNAVCNECLSLYPIYDRFGNIIEFSNNWSGNNIISYVTINGQKIKSDLPLVLLMIFIVKQKKEDSVEFYNKCN